MEKLSELVELVKKFNSAETRQDAVVINAKFNNLATRETIIKIDEAFKALEQAKQAAEHERDCHMDIAEHFKARCKELEQQKPYGYVHNLVNPPGSGVAASIFKEESRHYGRPVFTRPAPAADLADLVPDELTPKQASRSYGGEVVGYRDGWNACRAAILRNIEEAK